MEALQVEALQLEQVLKHPQVLMQCHCTRTSSSDGVEQLLDLKCLEEQDSTWKPQEVHMLMQWPQVERFFKVLLLELEQEQRLAHKVLLLARCLAQQ